MILGIDISRVNQTKRTGVEWYAYHLLFHFVEILPKDITVRLYTNEPLVEDLQDIIPDHWEVKLLRWPPKRLWTQLRLSFEMLFNAPDVLFVPAHVFPIIHPKKTVMTVHDIAARHVPESYNKFEQWYSLWSAKVAAKKLWRVITPTQFTKNDLVDFAGIKKTNHIVPIHLGIDKTFTKADPFQSDIKNMQERYGIKKPYLLSIGRLEHKKNTAQIVQAFNTVRKKHDVQLVLIGKPGFGYQEVATAIEQSPYKEDIILPGWVEEDDIPCFYAGAEIFLFPSLFEGFGIPIIESFAMGTPVISSHVSGIPEVAGDAALLLRDNSVSALAQAVHELLEDQDMQQEYVQKGKSRLEAFSWEETAKQTAAVLIS